MRRDASKWLTLATRCGIIHNSLPLSGTESRAPSPRRCDPIGPLLGLASARAPPSRAQVLRLLKPEFDSAGSSAELGVLVGKQYPRNKVVVNPKRSEAWKHLAPVGTRRVTRVPLAVRRALSLCAQISAHHPSPLWALQRTTLGGLKCLRQIHGRPDYPPAKLVRRLWYRWLNIHARFPSALEQALFL